MRPKFYVEALVVYMIDLLFSTCVSKRYLQFISKDRKEAHTPESTWILNTLSEYKVTSHGNREPISCASSTNKAPSRK